MCPAHVNRPGTNAWIVPGFPLGPDLNQDYTSGVQRLVDGISQARIICRHVRRKPLNHFAVRANPKLLEISQHFTASANFNAVTLEALTEWTVTGRGWLC